MLEVYATPKRNAEEIIKRAFWLAYKAARTSEMGFLKARDDASEDDVWENVKVMGDYPFGSSRTKRGEFYGDYVFGRMLKLRLNIHGREIGIDYPSTKVDIKYQSWGSTYPTYEELLRAATLELSGATP